MTSLGKVQLMNGLIEAIVPTLKQICEIIGRSVPGLRK